MDPQEALKARVDRAFSERERRGSAVDVSPGGGNKASRHAADKAYLSNLVKRSKEQADNKPDAASAWQVCACFCV